MTTQTASHYLAAHHQAMLTHESGIAPDIIAQRGYRTITDPRHLARLGFSVTQQQLLPALVIPFYDVHGHIPYYQARFDNPRPGKNGKPRRYEVPYETKLRLDVHPAMRAKLPDPDVPLFVVEGIKKSDALASHGACAIGLVGVWTWDVPCWEQIALSGRTVYITFDSDAAHNRKVQQAEDALVAMLLKRGAQVQIVRLPQQAYGEKVGADDFLTEHSLEELIRLARPAQPPLAQDAATPAPKLAIINAVDLWQKELPPLRWVAERILPTGLTLFFGKSKSGKSLAAWNIACAVASDHGKALGHYDVDTGDVLYLCLEDGERRAQQRLKDQMGDAPPPARLDIVTRDAPRVSEGLEAALTDWLDQHPEARLVVIDILEKIRPKRVRNGSVYADDYNALAPLQGLAQDRNIAILVIHHANKLKAEDYRDTASGSNALTGAADTLWSLERIAGKADAALHITGRDVDSQELALQFESGFWKVLGDADEYRMGQTAQHILAALREAGRPLTPVEVAKHLGIDRNTIRQSMARMTSREDILNIGDGRYIPRKVSLSPSPPPPPPPPIEEERESVSSETKSITGITGITAVTGITGVTGQGELPAQGQNGYGGYDDRNRTVTGLSVGKVTLKVPPVTPVTGVTPHESTEDFFVERDSEHCPACGCPDFQLGALSRTCLGCGGEVSP